MSGRYKDQEEVCSQNIAPHESDDDFTQSTLIYVSLLETNLNVKKKNPVEEDFSKTFWKKKKKNLSYTQFFLPLLKQILLLKSYLICCW